MATLIPFTGMRPLPEQAEKVAAPPYDVVSSEEAREMARDNPISFLHINKPEIDLPADVDVHSDAVYDMGRDNMARFLKEGIFIQDEKPAFYIYRQSLGDGPQQHSQTGIVGLVSADEYENNVVKKHELTRPEKENDRVRHMQAVSAQTGPVFLTYRADKPLEKLSDQCAEQAPVYDFTSDGVRHQFWVVSEPALIDEISKGFADVPALFVADGHHRSAAAVRYRALCRDRNSGHTGNENYNYFMAVLFPHEQLNILGYHRVVRDLGRFDEESFLDALAETYDIKPSKTQAMPDQPRQFGLYLDGQWYLLTLKPQAEPPVDAVSELDVSILQETILAPLLAIHDVRTDSRIDFIGGIRGKGALESAVDSGEYAAAFACYPVRIEQLLTIADQDKLMPPKSTWFEPKLKSGLVMHYLG